MANSQWVIDVDENDFNQAVIQQSLSTPVLVDIWAPWCGPCKTLGPILEQLAEEMQGRFILAKVNADDNQQLCQQMQVQGIPACKLVFNGEIVDEFTGALPKNQIIEFLDKNIPNEVANLIEQGKILEQNGDPQGAFNHYHAALEVEPNNTDALVGQARIFIAHDQKNEAQERLEMISANDQDNPEVRALIAQMEFSGNTDTSDLEARIKKNPDDLAARMELGRALIGQNQHEAGIDQFLEVVKRDRSFEDDAGRKAVLQTFDMLGPTHPMVPKFRSKLSSVLFS
ncbi:MAG: tetratricopeptide repeat protein [Magnetococcales bacterium]|nr:tetratricopeptide repeat protein [Magnetococcales bacterium]